MIKLSVIIPVYNVENYLSQCIDSVINQDARCELEVILIDDGSTDNSGAICDQYSLLDSRIKVIHKKNGGLSSARNRGIDESTGDYIVFLDSDDFWIENSLVNFVEIEEETQADIIIGNAIRYQEIDKQYREYPNNIRPNIQSETKLAAIAEILNPKNEFQWHVWKSFYKSELIKENKLYFMDGILFEDVEWNPKVFYHAESIASFDEIFVCYRVQRVGSITIDSSKQTRRLLDMLKAVESVTNYFNNTDIPKELKDIFFTNISKTFIYVFFRQTLIKEDDAKGTLEQLSFLMPYYKGKYSGLLNILIGIFGYSNVCLFFRTIGAIVFKIRFK